MKVKVKKEFELHSNHKAMEDDIFNLITINYENDSFFLILEKWGHIFNVYFKDEFDANKHLEFDYEEEKVCTADVYITENECNNRISQACKKKDEEIEYWKNKFLRLVDKF